MRKYYNIKHKFIGQGVHSNKRPIYRQPIKINGSGINDIVGNIHGSLVSDNHVTKSIQGGAVLNLGGRSINSRLRSNNKDTLVRMKF